nr:G patch domain-containing protein 1-like [Procambarus clarkii]
MSDSDEEECVFYGTPLEELDEGEVRSRKAPRIEDQVARDKQGRRRFHGAFTGGFSAGYFNSVGTKDGWTPSTYVSTTAQRAKSMQFRPQDFMDEEDLEAHGISPQGIQASANYDDNEQKKRKRVLDPGGPIPGTPVLEDILKPSRETMGMKLLRRLGWRPGQGVGPRLSRHQKVSERREKQRIFGCQGIQHSLRDSDSESDDDGHMQDLTYAPDDIDTLHLTQPKVDRFGLGYKPLDRTSVLGGHINLFDPSPLVMTDKKKKVLIKGQAFGVGAFEEEDEDIYATEDMSNYDFGEEKKESGRRSGVNKNQTPMTVHGLIEIIEGFTLSSKPQQQHKVYPRPILPRDFLPLHQPRRRRFERKESEIRGLGRHEMTAEQRSLSIAELPKTTVEVRSGVKGKTLLPPKDQPESIDTLEVEKIYDEFKNSGSKFSSDFKPFSKDPDKQRRYDLFLRMKERGQKDRFRLVQPKSMTEWQKEREVHEFSRAAHLFQPLTSTMANRFVSAATPDSGPMLKDGLNVNIPKIDPATNDADVDALGHNIADERVKAAKMNMFGKLTQTVMDWHPDRLLCRRFNVPNPYPESSVVGVSKSQRKRFSIFNFLDAPEDDKPRNREVSPSPSESAKRETTEDEDLDKSETFGLKIPVDGPPTMDLFKAIFQSSGSESNSDSEDEKPTSIKMKQDSCKDTQSQRFGPSIVETSLSSQGKYTSGSEMDSGNSCVVTMASIGNTLENKSAEDTSKDLDTVKRPDRQRVRISRFEPNKDGSKGEVECLPKPVFIQRRKKSADTEATPAEGIFANIDFEELNSYRNTEALAIQNQTTNITDKVKESVNKSKKFDSDSSVDSEDEYGPPVPVHLKNRIQMIKSSPSSTASLVQQGKQDTVPKEQSLWVEKVSKIKSKKHKNKDKHKYKKEKKKKKDKKHKKHKEKKQKKKEHKSQSRKSSSCSNSDLSDSD